MSLKTGKWQQQQQQKVIIIIGLSVDFRVHAWMISHVWLFVIPWTIACQAPLSLGFSRPEYCNGLPFPPPRDLRIQGSNPCILCLLLWQAYSLPLHCLGKSLTKYLFFFFFNCSGFCRTLKWISHGFTCVPIFILHSLVSCCHLTQTPWTLDHLTKRLGMNLKCRSYRKVNTENIIYMWNVNKLIETNNKVMVTRNWGVGEIGRHWSKSMHF